MRLKCDIYRLFNDQFIENFSVVCVECNTERVFFKFGQFCSSYDMKSLWVFLRRIV